MTLTTTFPKSKPFPSDINWRLYETEGLFIFKKPQKTYNSYTIKDTDGNKIKLNYNNHLEISSTFETDGLRELGERTMLSKEEAEKKHAGKFIFKFKLSKPITEIELIQKYLIPESKVYGLLPSSFTIAKGQSPNYSSPFLPGFEVNTYASIEGNYWWAYTKRETGEIWISSKNDNWNWERVSPIEQAAIFCFHIAKMNKLELEWLRIIHETAKAIYNLSFHEK